MNLCNFALFKYQFYSKTSKWSLQKISWKKSWNSSWNMQGLKSKTIRWFRFSTSTLTFFKFQFWHNVEEEWSRSFVFLKINWLKVLSVYFVRWNRDLKIICQLTGALRRISRGKEKINTSYWNRCFWIIKNIVNLMKYWVT